jgi:O-antigen/teichoic acid export membrane protein
MRKAIVFSFAVEFAVMLSMMAGFRIASDNWGDAGFGAWALTRRLLSFMVPLIICGIEISIPRSVARHLTLAPKDSSAAYFDAGMLIVGAGLGVASVVLLLWRDAVAVLVFGDAAQVPLVLPLWALLVGYCVYFPCYAYLRGKMRITEASFAHLIMYGALPLIPLYLVPSSAPSALLAMGGLSLAFALTCIVAVRSGESRSSQQLGTVVRQLVTYGMPRMYASFGLMALMTLPPVLVAHRDGIAEAGIVAFGVTLVGLAASVVTPIGVTLLPFATRTAASGDGAALTRLVHRIELAALLVGGAIAIVLFALAPLIASVFLATPHEGANGLLRICALGIVPYVYFVCVRNLLDAIAVRSIATWAVLIALVTFILASVALVGVVGMDAQRGMLLAYASSLLVLALQSAVAVRRLVAARRTPHAREDQVSSVD